MKQRKLGKKILSQILTVAMVFSLGGNSVPVSVLASAEEIVPLEGSAEPGEIEKGTEANQEETIGAPQTEAEEMQETEPVPEIQESTEIVEQTEPQTEIETEVCTEPETEIIETEEPIETEGQPVETEEETEEPIQEEEPVETEEPIETEAAPQVEAPKKNLRQTNPISVTTQIYFRSNGNGYVNLDGNARVDHLFKDVPEGNTVPVPVPEPMAGYQFKEWRKGSASGEVVTLGDSITATTEDQTYYAIFEAKQIEVTFKVKDQTGATIAKNDNFSTNVDEYTVVASFQYKSSGITLRFPKVTAMDGYNGSTTSTSNTYWVDDATGKRVNYSSFSGPKENESYTLVVGAATTKAWEIEYVDKDGNLVYSATGKNNINEERSAHSSYAIKQIEAKGYAIPDEIKAYTLVYDRANHMALKNVAGDVIQEGIQGEKYMTFTLTVEKAYTITTSGNEYVTIDASGKGIEGEDYTVNFEAQEGYVITKVTVDGVELSQEEIEALNGSYTFTNLSEDHTIAVEAKKATKIYFCSNGNGMLTLNGEVVEDKLFENIPEGNTVSVPVPVPAPGYQFKEWRKGSADGEAVGLAEAVTATTEDQTYYAIFEGKQIEVTFKVKDQTGATIAENDEYSTKVDEYTVVASFQYSSSGITLNFPSITAMEGYNGSITSDGNTYWIDDATGERAEESSFDAPTENASYTLIVGAVSPREWEIQYVDKDGNPVYTATGENKIGEEQKAVTTFDISQIEKEGYVISDEMKSYTILYDDANHMVLKDAAGQVVQEGVVGHSYITFTLTVQKVYTVTTSGNDNVMIDASGKGIEGEDYTVNFEAKKGCVIVKVVVDGVELSQEEIKALNGSYTFTNLSADHTIVVEAKAISTVSFYAGENGSLKLNGTEEKQYIYEEVLDGTVLAVPTPVAAEGYQFKEWRKGSVSGEVIKLGETVTVTAEDQSYYAIFEGKQIEVTFKVKDHVGATITKNDKYSVNEDKYTVKASFIYQSTGITLNFPIVTIESGYEAYWIDDATGERVNVTAISGPSKNVSYTLVTVPQAERNLKVHFVDANGNIVYTVGSSIKLNEELRNLISGVSKQVENRGYKIDPESQIEYTFLYDGVNHVVMKDKQGKIIQEGTFDAEGNVSFTIKVTQLKPDGNMKESAKTGDTTNVERYLLLMLSAAILIVAGLFGRRKRKWNF